MRARRRASSRVFVAVLLAAASLMASTPAHVGGAGLPANDHAATATYLRASLAQAHAGQRAVKMGTIALRLFVADVGRECGGILTDVPSLGARRGQVEEAIVGVLTVKLTRFAAPENVRFSHAVRFLKWTSQTLTRRVSAFATAVAEGASAMSVELPICATLRTWADGGFRTLPNALSQFSGQLERAARKRSEPLERQEQTILSLLWLHETSGQRSAARRARRQTDATAAEAVGVLARAKLELFRALGINL